MRSDIHGFLPGSATIGTMLLVSGSAKVGYGVWALGMAAFTCVLYGAGKYGLAQTRMLIWRRPWTARFRYLRERRDKGQAVAAIGTAAP
jgi:hypothetical protein